MYKEQMIKVLKDSCGGTCLTDPDNCACFGKPSQEEIDDLGIDFEEGDEFYEPEHCTHYINIFSKLRHTLEKEEFEKEILIKTIYEQFKETF